MATTRRLPQRQRGAVLVTSLIILLVMTLISVSGMRSATFEEKMAANDMQYNIAFQAAESVVETALQDTSRLSSALADGSSNVTVNLDNPAVTADGTVRYLGKGPALGFGIGDEDSYVNYFFEVSGNGQIAAVDAVRRTLHGVRVIGPDADN